MEETLKKDNYLKRYYIHFLNILILFFIGVPFILLFKQGETEPNKIIMIIVLALEGINVLFTFIETIYFIMKAIKMKDLTNKIIKILLIYLFPWIYIPVFYTKYIYKYEPKNNSNAIYITVATILLFIICCTISFFNISLNNYDDIYSNSFIEYIYKSENNDILKISVPDDYIQKEGTSFDLYLKNQLASVTLFFYTDNEESAEQILEFQIKQLLSQKNNNTLIDEENYSTGNKIIKTKIYKYENNNETYVNSFSVITFNDNKNIVYIAQNCHESLYKDQYDGIFKKIIESISV